MANYTNGKEYLLGDVPYRGPYFIVSGTDKAYTGSSFIFGISKELTRVEIESDLDLGIYPEINPDYYNKATWYPVSYYPMITDKDIENRWIYRFFAQKANSVTNPIVEVEGKDYNTCELYKFVKLKWYIIGPDQEVVDSNSRAISDNLNILPTLDQRLKNQLELNKN